MDIGKLRHRITFQYLSDNRNQYGEPTGEWLDFKTVWASINPISGREFFQADTDNSEITHRVFMRYCVGIKRSMRIKFNQRIFGIESIINYEEKNLYLQLMCKELVE